MPSPQGLSCLLVLASVQTPREEGVGSEWSGPRTRTRTAAAPGGPSQAPGLGPAGLPSAGPARSQGPEDGAQAGLSRPPTRGGWGAAWMAAGSPPGQEPPAGTCCEKRKSVALFSPSAEGEPEPGRAGGCSGVWNSCLASPVVSVSHAAPVCSLGRRGGDGRPSCCLLRVCCMSHIIYSVGPT